MESEWIGTTVGLVDAQIHSQVTGYLRSQHYREGALVEAGALLFQVDPRPFQAVADQAKAQVTAAEAQQREASAAVKQGEAEVARAQASLRKTQLDVERYSPLVVDGTVSKQELDDAVQSNLANEAAVAEAQGKLERARAAVAQADANIAVAASVLEKARLDLSFTSIRAPITGIAGIHSANIGELVGPTGKSLLTTVSQVEPLYVEFPVSEKEYFQMRNLFANKTAPSEGLDLYLADGSLYPHTGRIEIVGRQVDMHSGTLRVRALFPNPGNLLRPGQYARVRMVTQRSRNALLAPQRAVQDLQGLYQVMVLNTQGSVEVRTVKVGPRLGAWWVIESGLQALDQVVVEGFQKIKQGDRVQSYAARNLPALPEPATKVRL